MKLLKGKGMGLMPPRSVAARRKESGCQHQFVLGDIACEEVAQSRFGGPLCV